MILYTDSVPLTPRQRELVRIQSPDFPYSAMEGELTRYANRGALWHWHDYFEFAVIHRGLVELDLERECFRCFTRSLDVTPTEYLTRHRVDAAARLLRESSMSAAEIAAACGFTDASYFGKTFRREFGCTPGQYRRRS